MRIPYVLMLPVYVFMLGTRFVYLQCEWGLYWFFFFPCFWCYGDDGDIFRCGGLVVVYLRILD